MQPLHVLHLWSLSVVGAWSAAPEWPIATCEENGPGLFQTRVHPRKRHRRQVRGGAPSSWQQRAYLVGCHHKSGTELLRHIMMRTFDVLGGMDSCNYNTTGGQLTSFSPMRSDCQLHPARLRYDNHVSGEVIQELRALTQHAGGFRGVLTVRDPLEMVVSAYVYHHRGNEPNTGLGMNIAQMGPEKGVPEMARRMIKIAHHMVDAYKVAPPDMYIIRFEIITNSSKNFNRTIQEMVRFLFREDITERQRQAILDSAVAEDLQAGENGLSWHLPHNSMEQAAYGNHTNDDEDMMEARNYLPLVDPDLLAKFQLLRAELGYTG